MAADERVHRVPSSLRPNGPIIAKGPSVRTVTAAQLMIMSLPEPRCVVKAIVVEGLSALVGRPKIGKSWMQAAIGLAVATGGRAFGQIQVEQGEALYLALEDTARRLQDRLKKLLLGSCAPEGLKLATFWPRFNAGGLQLLDAWLTQHPAARFVGIDTWAKIRPPHRRGGDLYGDDYEALSNLKTVADRHRVAILVSHHLRKSEAEDPVDEVSGTQGLAGALDSILILRRARGQHEATLFVTGRDLEEQEFGLRWDATLGLWTLLGDAAELRRSRERADVITALRSQGPLRAKALAELLGKKEATVRWLLAEMAKDGDVQRVLDGYVVPNTTHTLSSPTKPIEQTAPTGPTRPALGVGAVGGAGQTHEP